MCYCFQVNKLTSKSVLSFIVLVLLCIPIATSSLLDLEQKRANELLLEQERIQKEAELKIYLMGKFEPTQREDFALVPSGYAAVENQMYLRKEALGAFLNMAAAASRDGIDLRVASAARNFIYQKDIWEKKWTGVTYVDGKNLTKSIPDGLERFEKILEYSAAPGTSRHHWGTDIDINNANVEYFNTKNGEKIYEWLSNNAWVFGFCQPYNIKGNGRITGYNEEKWHWSYLPLAGKFTEEYKNLIKNEDISGFLGAEYGPGMNLISDYVLGINPECL